MFFVQARVSTVSKEGNVEATRRKDTFRRGDVIVRDINIAHRDTVARKVQENLLHS